MRTCAVFCIAVLMMLGGTPSTARLLRGEVATGNDPTVGILPSYNDAYVNWTKAGMQSVGGIPIRTTQCGSTISPSGITPPAGGDDSLEINAAIVACSAGQVVQLGCGQFQIDVTEYIYIGKGITLRGCDACPGSTKYSYCGTQIIRPNGLLKYQNGMCGNGNPTPCSVGPIIFISPLGINSTDWSACAPSGIVANCTGNYTSLTADAAQGQTTVTVASTTNFSVGMAVLINEATNANWVNEQFTRQTVSSQVWASSDLLNSTGGPATGRIAYLYYNPYPGYGCANATCAEGESVNYSHFYDRPTEEIHIISAINAGANTITFDSPLAVAMRQSGGHAAGLFIPWNISGNSYEPMLQNAGVENMTIGRGDQGNIQFDFCEYCWAKNIESYGWEDGAIEIDSSIRIQVENVYGYECWNSGNSGAEYAFDLKGGAAESMLWNSIMATSGKSMTSRAAGEGNVIAYNYFSSPWYDSTSGIGNYWIDLSANSSHYPGTHHTLFEGNQAINMDGDDTHGSGADYMSFFRNWSMGYRPPFTDPELNLALNDYTGANLESCTTTPVNPTCTPASAPGNLRTAGPDQYNYWYAFVGNVMGTSSQSTTGNGWTYWRIFASGAKSIYESGNVFGENAYQTYDNNLNLNNSSRYMFNDGNYDYVNAAVVWNTTSHALPNSLYLSSAPAFFSGGASCTYPFPWVTPTGGSQVQSAGGPGSCSTYGGLPAKARWDAGTPLAQP